ncbi:restriction endonuclease subunit S [Campylobacter sp. JMF_08 NE1]|uniref:restriction endonuclease subunit S n=1 Tax=Campylobacter sp. JMF_08 NE1 TaxID=2983821 RepID=UPI0022E9E23E|nr:restriction endonuclease subunit S [Campylobacter sp. JMF_08 NE1]MDA3047579.1 restriction endonuclease subunit S [Campylobacter sp. JMF_08 NE1]
MDKNSLPKHWQTKPLGEVGEVISGGTPSTADLENFGGDIAWITPADLSNYTDKFISHGSRNITEKGLKSSSAKLMPKGSILFSSRAPIGYVAIASNQICTNQGFKNLIPYDFMNSEFIYYYLKNAKHLALELASGTTFKEISAKNFAKIPIPVPPLSEQKQIVGEIERRFEKLDKAIENFRQILKNLKLYRQSVLKFAFDGKFTNPNLTNWQTKPLGEVVSQNKHSIKRGPFGSSLKKEFFVSNGIRIFEQYNPINQDPNFKRYFITEEKFKELEAFMACGGDLLISCSGTIGKILELPQNVEKGIINQALLKITLDNEKILNSFFVLFFQSPKMQKEILENTIGTAIKNIVGVKELKQIQIPIPPLSEQKQIVSEIEKRFAKANKIENLINKSLKNAEILKQSILKQAFSGNLKVKK